jgi:tRNA 2-selenouridine synthase
MAVQQNNIVDYINSTPNYLLLDVRSPAEFEHAHIPGAHSLPLFDNEQRAIVGTTYKKQSREDAIKIALPFFGSKMKDMVEIVEKLSKEYEKKYSAKPVIFVHCWRGGMRSAAVAWLLDLYGFKVIQLLGGYKAYRNWVIDQFNQSYSLKILGGYTGSGKTEILKELAANRKTFVDLEGLAKHKGSSFGALGQGIQPSQEMFENLLAQALYQENKKGLTIWLEDESQRIGTVMIPGIFFKQMRASTCYFLNIPFESRLNFIVNNYGTFDTSLLIEATKRIEKRLGGLETKNAIQYLNEGATKEAFEILLKYYDKWYDKNAKPGVEPTLNLINIDAESVNTHVNANLLMGFND